MRARLRAWLRPVMSDGGIDEVLLATGEAIANALEHGVPPVTMTLCWEAEGRLEVTIRDEGEWRVSSEASSRGLGLPIMSKLMDNVEVDTVGGTSVNLSRRFGV